MHKKTERAIAISILSEVLESGAYANIALRKALAKESDSLPRARAFITELVNETLRNLLLIDHVINAFSKTPLDRMKPFIRNLLRVSVCQLRHMEKIPDRAAVNEAVVLAKAFGFTNLSGFVNGVLRNISRQPENPALPPPDSIKGLALRYSYPEWIISELTNSLGEEQAGAFCQNSHLPPPITIHVNTYKTSVENLVQSLNSEGVEARCIEHPFLALTHTGDISKLASFQEGLFFVMDPGAIAAVNELAPKPGQKIMDMCAAPGGKSFAMACIMGNVGKIIAYDIHPHRVELVNQTRRRLGLSIIEAGVGDGLIFDPALESSADSVLLDVPCSGLGTLRKHPEIKYTREHSDIRELAEKQQQMLANAAKYIKPGGTLVYCTCTVCKEENSDNIGRFLAENTNFTLENSRQLLPNTNNDGFFVAKLARTV